MRDQWVVTISTDAPVPQFGDRLLVEALLDDGRACAGCVRDVDVSATASWPISFGVTPAPGGAKLHVRARLYAASDVTAAALQPGEASIDALASLPSPEGVAHVAVSLHAACFAIASDPVGHVTCDPGTRALSVEPVASDGAPLATGSWSPAAEVRCPASAPAGTTCIPGDVLLMGSRVAGPLTGDARPLPTHIVTVSPFVIDTAEVTVGAVRSLLSTGALDPSLAPTARALDPRAVEGACQFARDGSRDAYPVNCVTFAGAAAICTALGKRLPTEAEWELAARGTAERAYPWGDDDDLCGHAIVGRGRNSVEAVQPEISSCRTEEATALPPGPVAGGSSTDVTPLGVRDLGGSMSEWVADDFAGYADACWNGGAPALANPRCAVPSAGHEGERSVRGGSWRDLPALAAGAARASANETLATPSIGVRCARSF